MKPFNQLTSRGQVRRLRQLALEALREFGLTDARLTFIRRSENTIFRVDAPGALPSGAAPGLFVEGRFLLRVHRPTYQTSASIASELAWLAALRRDAQLAVPEPVPTLDGKLTTQATAPGVPGPRDCSLMRWVSGRARSGPFKPAHFCALGDLLARLHQHAARWQPPPGFDRRHWDWEGLFGDGAGFNLEPQQVWSLLPQARAGPFRQIADLMEHAMDALGQDPAAFGLIHADLFLGYDGNLLYSGRELRPLDFDDCGFGHWIYDLAVPLAHWTLSDAWPAVRDALLQGYTQLRPLPQTQLKHLDLFMAARHVHEILWATDLAQINAEFRQELDGWTDWAATHVSQFLERRPIQ